jgi:hypothetical protein
MGKPLLAHNLFQVLLGRRPVGSREFSINDRCGGGSSAGCRVLARNAVQPELLFEAAEPAFDLSQTIVQGGQGRALSTCIHGNSHGRRR